MTIPSRNFALSSASLLAFFLTWSFAYSLFPLWLNQVIGLSGERTGAIFSVNAATALLIMPAYGIVQDKLGLKKHLLYLVAVFLIGTGPFFIFIYGPLLEQAFWLGAIIGGVYSAIAFGAGVGALETYIERLGRNGGFEFGRARMFGSLGWALATFCAGFIFNIAPIGNFILASVAAVIFVIAIRQIEELREDGSSNSTPSVTLKDASKLVTNPRFWALAVYVMGASCIYSVYDQQFPIFFASLFPTQAEGNAMFGYLNSLQVFLEAGGMFLAPSLINRIGAKNGLVLAGVIMAVRIGASGYSETPLEVSLVKLLHAVELPIMLIALFKYIAATFDVRMSATVYLVGFQFSTQVMASLLSVAVGVMYDSVGFVTTYKILGVVVAATVFVSWFLLTPDQSSSPDRATQI